MKQPTVACLEVLWMMAGCDLNARYAPLNAPEKQRLHWLGQTPFDALDDMSWYATYARQRKSPYEDWCLTPEKMPKKGRFSTGSIRATYEDRLVATLDLTPLAERLAALFAKREPLSNSIVPFKTASVISQSASMYRSVLINAQNQDKVRTAILRENVERVYASRAPQRESVLDRNGNGNDYILWLEENAKTVQANLLPKGG